MTQIIIDKIQFKRGTTTQRMALVLDLAEPFYDEDEQAEYIGDGVTVGGNPSAGLSGGISQGAADSRYIKQSQIDQPNGVAGLDAGSAVLESALPVPPINLTLLFDNQIA